MRKFVFLTSTISTTQQNLPISPQKLVFIQSGFIRLCALAETANLFILYSFQFNIGILMMYS